MPKTKPNKTNRPPKTKSQTAIDSISVLPAKIPINVNTPKNMSKSVPVSAFLVSSNIKTVYNN